MTPVEQFAHREKLRQLREGLRYARSQACKDWRYSTIARSIEAEIAAMTCGRVALKGSK